MAVGSRFQNINMEMEELYRDSVNALYRRYIHDRILPVPHRTTLLLSTSSSSSSSSEKRHENKKRKTLPSFAFYYSRIMQQQIQKEFKKWTSFPTLRIERPTTPYYYGDIQIGEIEKEDQEEENDHDVLEMEIDKQENDEVMENDVVIEIEDTIWGSFVVLAVATNGDEGWICCVPPPPVYEKRVNY